MKRDDDEIKELLRKDKNSNTPNRKKGAHSATSDLADNSSGDTRSLCQYIYNLDDNTIDSLSYNEYIKTIKDHTSNIQSKITSDRVMSASVMEFLLLFIQDDEDGTPDILSFSNLVEDFVRKTRRIMFILEKENVSEQRQIDAKNAALGILIRICDCFLQALNAESCRAFM